MPNQRDAAEAAFRADMVKRLHDQGYWPRFEYLICPICGALIHPSTRDLHIMWHDQNNA